MIRSICVTVICACLLASAERTEDANSENGEELLNRETRSTTTISAEVGKNVILPCYSESSKDNKVTWMDPKRRLLSVNDQMTINDARMYIDKPRLEDWNLGIYNARVADSGEYLCQIDTEPIISHRVYLVVTEAQTQGDTCRECNAYGRSHPPNEEFTHRDGCREYHCDCECSGKWNCPDERIKDTCKPECGTCSAGGEIREGNTPFKFKEDCYLYDCFCKCDGDWNCPKEKSIDTCRTNTTTGCYYCDVYGKRYEGNSHFKHVNGCIEYDCTCKCDGGWDCPGDKAVDKCKINPSTDCTRCQVFGQEYEGNTYFKYVNGCIELTCGCNCDGSWSCPGENARDLCLTNQTTGCYYCDVYNYLYQGNSQFPLVQDCYKYSCDCACDGGWTCKHSIGKYVCDQFGKEPQDCNTCSIDGNVFRGDSRFFYQRGCVKYMCTCDCEGRYLCSGSDAHITCENADIEYIVSLRSGAMRLRTEHTRGPRQINENCIPCLSDGKTYAPYERFSKQVKCNTFSCTCGCNGLATCPPETAVYNCEGPSSSGRRVSTVTTQTGRDNVGGSGVSTCRDCTYLGATYEGGSPFEFERGCFRYHCNCNCDGSFECLSEDSEYICPGREECLKCDVSETAGEKQLIEPNTDFELRRGCILYDKCRCNCDGGWSCGDGQYTCDLCQGCKEGGNRYPGNSTFQMAKGCDLYTNCFCGCDGKWTCSGEGIKDLCPTCRKCKIGTEYYDGGTSFSASVNCTTYRECDCMCDGTYSCRRGVYMCDNRGDQPVEGQCTDCVHGRRRFRPGQSFDYTSDCSSFRDCQCKCGTTHCREVEDTCGTCRACQLDGVEYPGGTKFSSKTGCTIYKECDCFCNGTWKCYGESVIDTCNECRKCNVDGDVYEPYSRFTLDRKCWKYQCFCACDGSTRCPSDTVINTCVTADKCNMCEVDGRQIRGNTHFSYDLNDMTMSCRCNCDGSYVCIAEWLYMRKDVSISGSGIGSGAESCLSCIMDGRSYRGGNNYTISRYGVNMNCQCNCNGGYYCYGTVSFEGAGCRRCSVYQHRYDGDSNFAVVFNGFRLACRCSCDGSYVCLGSVGSTVISCVNGIGCLPSTCGRCVVDGVVFNGGDQFGTIYNGRQLTCDCGCDGSYYCEGSGGSIISCVGGRCTELGCGSCNVFGNSFGGNSNFDLIYKGLKLTCQCQCGGSYRCSGSSGEVIVSCIDGSGCLTGTCNSCLVNNRRIAGGSTFRYDYNGVDMICTCACDGSYYCKGVSELIEISCIGGTCSRIGCESCNVFGIAYPGDTSFSIVYAGVKIQCQCSCDSGYRCMGSTGTSIVTCVNGRGCLPSTCSPCVVNGLEYAGRSTFRSSYKGIDVMCTCGCDSSSFCAGITTSIEVSCIGGSCTRVGCRECSIFGKEYLGSSQFDIIYQGIKLTCECDCEGGYICRGSTGVTVVTCVNGVGPGCLRPGCKSCVVDGREHLGRSTFRYLYNGIDMQCTCACDSSYYCEGVSELIQISCIGGTCSPVGCKSCSLFGREYSGASTFDLIYAGLVLKCQCNCDGGYTCVGSSGTRVVYCRDGGKGCLPQTCDTCMINDKRYAGGSTAIRDTYNGIDVMCSCGCDGSVVCTGVTTTITISCIGGKCSPIGCGSCRVFGREYDSLSKFEIIYAGVKLNCQCECSGGYLCTGSTGETTVECRDSRGCLPQICNTCSFNGREYRGLAVFKHLHNGIDFSCTCGCDGSVFCQGVTQLIELRCIGGLCTPIGCQACNVFGNEVATMTKFEIIYRGMRLSCDCSCTGGYVCRGSAGTVIVDCGPDGRNCLPATCRSCFRNNREIRGGSTYRDVYEGIDMTCTCACDGSSFCTGVSEVIDVSCIGDTCSPVGCRTCSIFGQEYQAISKFDIIYQGVRLNCRCSCDSSYVCTGSTGEVIVKCTSGIGCLPLTCRDCVVNGRTYKSKSTFSYIYEDIDMKCSCGCDGSSFCEGVKEVLEVSCIGDTCSPRGCRTCSIFGQEYQAISKFDIIYQGVRLNCRCSCDSSYVCTGSTGEVIVKCTSGIGCLPLTCRDCVVGGRTYKSSSTFSYIYEDIDMKCSCGCDGSSFCEGVKDVLEVSCIGDTCSPRGCRTCSIFGQEYQAISKFDIIYQGVRLNCRCSCDSSYVCTGSTGEVIVDCTSGSGCLPLTCRDCVVDGRRYNSRSTFPYVYKGIDMKCTCGCDGTSFCEGVTEVIEISCNGESCSPRGCRTCNIFGQEYRGDSNFALVYKGIKMQCDCNCDTSYRCEGFSSVLKCGVGKRCVPNRCRLCRVNGRRYDGGSTFEYDYKGVLMSCVCGCDGSYYCEGKTTDFELSCQRRGDCNQIGGCRSCSIFGQKYAGESRTDFVYQGYFMTCSCACDSSYTCTGVKGNVVITCPSGRNCLTDTCGTCRIDRNTFVGMSEFDTVYKGQNFRCTCGCDGSYYCRCKDDGSEISCDTRGTCSQIGCKECISDNRRRQADEEFEKIFDGIQMNCLCACDGSYRCQGAVVKITISCTGDACSLIGCRSCIVDGREYASGSDYEMTARGRNYRCRCECDGQSTCSVIQKVICKSCDIDGVTYKGHTRNRVYRGTQPFVCDCYCSGESKCTPERPVCRECTIGSQQFAGNTNFEAAFDGLTFQCTCNCQGGYVCKSDSRTCTSVSGCVDTCRECTIAKRKHAGNTNFETVIGGILMQCRCDCSGGYECTSDTRRCTSTSGCVDICRECVIENRKHAGNTNFEAVVGGILMKCRCDCSSGYECTSDTRRCTSTSGCVDICRECVIENRKHAGNTNFETVVGGKRMQCSCDCSGGYECTSDTRRCTSTSGCVDICRECVIENRKHAGNTNFETVVGGKRMQCSCDCSGGYECTSDTRRCTSTSGCVDICRECVIENRKYAGNTNFEAVVQGSRMQCSCDCLGGYRCTNEIRTCTSVSGCIDTCRKCNIDNVRYDGNTRFQAVLQGTRMECSCDCSGLYECHSGTTTCTYATGCVDICRGCDIEGNQYKGNTQFDIFHNAYGIRMNCECKCGGSYTCRGTKTVTSCVGAGCPDSGCNNCVVDGKTYEGNSRFDTIIDGIRVTCTCSCDGGYKCVGKQTTTTCTGPGCVADIRCNNCIIGGNTYAGNTEFQLDKNDVRMKCYCMCDGSFTCRGEKTTTVCIGAGCDGVCSSCNVDGRIVEGNSRFETVKDGIKLDCTCQCDGGYKCEGTVTKPCTGPECATTGCRRCIIDKIPYTGNTRFDIRKGNIDFSCTCYCDGSYTCKGSTGIETSCVGKSCAADKCRSCQLDGRAYELDARFRLAKNNLVMNCVCECDGAYRCFSISGSCVGGECDDYGCSSCTIEGKQYKGNSEFELASGSTCTCDCSGQYTCRSKSLIVQCVGADCGIGGCRRCNVDGTEYAGNTRFQLTRYGLTMQCACNCDSSYTCRGYQIISTGTSEVDLGCKQCEIEGRTFNGNSRFQTLVNGIRSVCSCACDGRYSCSGTSNECRPCSIGGQQYASNSDFVLTQGDNSIQCRCDCNGDFICEGRKDGECRGAECMVDGCRDCVVFGNRYRGDSRFTTDAGGARMLCECHCNGGYSCKGYRHVTNILLPAEKESTCATCYVAGQQHPGNSKFKIQRGCFVVDCVCGCDGIWECPEQEPKYACSGNELQSNGYDVGRVVTSRYSIAGSHVYTAGSVPTDSRSTLVYTEPEGSSTVFGAGRDQCRTCSINGKDYEGNTQFVLQDGCLRWTCSCDCTGGWNCTSVEGSDCSGPLDPFESKTCIECSTKFGTFPPNKQFQASDECYRYTCTCNCDGSWECPPQLTIKTCSDSSVVHSSEAGTCRQCLIGRDTYNYGDTFEYVDQCIKYRCECACDGSYYCPSSNAVRVCRSGSGSGGRIPGSGSETLTQTHKTFVNIRPVGIRSSTSVSESSQTSGGSSSTSYGSRASGYETVDGSSGAAGYDSSRYSGSIDSSSGSSGSTYRIKASSSTGSDGSAESVSGGESSSRYSKGQESGASTSSGSSSGSSRSSSTSQDSSSESGISYGTSSGAGTSYGTSRTTGEVTGGRCRDCVVNGEALSGGRDFTFRSGCTEYLCECFCNGSYVCPPERSTNFCEEEARTRDRSRETTGCTVGNRTYKTKLFSYTENCLKYICRCYDNGSYNCDSDRTKRVC